MMKLFFLFSYLIFVTISLGGAWIWARKQSRKARKLREPSSTQEFVFSSLPKEWFLSFQFYLGVALATFIAVAIYNTVAG
jgi:hypothetical protein